MSESDPGPVTDPEPPDAHGAETEPEPAVPGEYTWAAFMREHGYEEEIDDAYRRVRENTSSGSRFDRFLGRGSTNARRVPHGADWAGLSFDPAAYLGFDPDELDDRVACAKRRTASVLDHLNAWLADTPVTKDLYTWEHFRYEYHYDAGRWPLDADGDRVPFDAADYLGFDPDQIEARLAAAGERAATLREVEDRRTVDVNEDLDEDRFFSTVDGHTTLTNRYDLEKAVPMEKKLHFQEVERYWVDKPNAFVVIFHSSKENEYKYYLVGPYMNEIERSLRDFLTRKLRTTIKYSDDVVIQGSAAERREVLERELYRLLDRYTLYDGPVAEQPSFLERLAELVPDGLPGLTAGDTDGEAEADASVGETDADGAADEETAAADEEDARDGGLDGIAARPEPVVVAEEPTTLTEYQVAKLTYLLRRDFVGYERIDGIKHDVNVEDISCDGYDSPVFVYHTEYEQLISNVTHGREQLDKFVVKLAQRSGKSISKRHPQVDATLPDGSRAQLTLGREVSDHGTNYTIRQFKDVPFTPIDLVNWHTFSLEEMVFLWLCIENKKSLMFAGGTASGKTTSLNAVSLFVPSNAKIVSIEDTREVELPQRNWIASVTRPSFSHNDEQGDIDEFDLLEAALRQRPDYILMGEVRGEEGRTLFQVMSTGHTTLTTFHADSVDEVLKRFTTDPINVSKTMFTALDLVSVQTQTRIRGEKVRRNRTITEINHYDTEKDEINVQDTHVWYPEHDAYRQTAASGLYDEIRFDRGWSSAELEAETFKRKVVLAYLIKHELNEYAQVAATLQAFINDPDTILALIARDRLEERLEDLRGMESVLIDIDPEKEELVPRPDPTPETMAEAEAILAEAEDRLLEEYRDRVPSPLVDALPTVEPAEHIVVDRPDASDGDQPPADAAATHPGADAGDGERPDADADDAASGDAAGALLHPMDRGTENDD